MADERTPTTVSPTGRNTYDVAKNKGKEKRLAVQLKKCNF